MTTTKFSVLWIEDSADDIEMFSMAFDLVKAPFTLVTQNDGQSAFDYLIKISRTPEHWPHLILLDFSLPRRDGRELLAEIKKMDMHGVPVVVLTASNAESDILLAYSLGAACYLVKPHGPTEIAKLARSFSDFWRQVVYRQTAFDGITA